MLEGFITADLQKKKYCSINYSIISLSSQFSIKVDLRLSILKPLHANVMKEAHQFFESLKNKEVILNGWRAAGITESLWQTRKKNENSLYVLIMSRTRFRVNLHSKGGGHICSPP